jgi:ATP-dependent DNA helicase RecG
MPMVVCLPLVFLTRLAQYLKAYKYVKEFGEGIDRICSELETKGCAIPSFHVDAFILKATLMAEWTSEKEFDRSSTVQVPSNYRPSSVQVEKLVQLMHDEYLNVSKMMELCGIKHRMTFRENYINPALSDGSIERKYPDQPNHPKQMYRLTEQAKVWKLNNID